MNMDFEMLARLFWTLLVISVTATLLYMVWK